MLRAKGICRLSELSRITERDLSAISGIGPLSIARLRPLLCKDGQSVELHSRPMVVGVLLQPETLTKLDCWSVENLGAEGSRAEAVRQLVEHGLTCLDMANRKKRR